MDQFNPALATRRLREVAVELQNIGEQIITKRNEVALLEASYLGAKAGSLKKHLADKSATAAQLYVTIDTVEDKKKLIHAESELKNLQDKQRIIDEGNQNHKMAIKIALAEMSNLNH